MNEIQKLVPAGAESIALSPKGTIMLRTVGEAAGFAMLMASSGMLPRRSRQSWPSSPVQLWA